MTSIYSIFVGINCRFSWYSFNAKPPTFDPLNADWSARFAPKLTTLDCSLCIAGHLDEGRSTKHALNYTESGPRSVKLNAADWALGLTGCQKILEKPLTWGWCRLFRFFRQSPSWRRAPELSRESSIEDADYSIQLRDHDNTKIQFDTSAPWNASNTRHNARKLSA
jgi:hypothetical protein